ncbi:ABC transporter permease [Mucilaginibacter sp. RS28]|uniref:ABC transporter permease n=1 Tax=Mucilaginibacter straminoryzae TaxID=2932774 RepID=A0A9X2BBS0_9SPHI|nr:ABC transporter permease [Mucilaginibacter straminoryzae]MCJ8208563.1 ABC transporter permease [Mucilaginibacter straminoryzae]
MIDPLTSLNAPLFHISLFDLASMGTFFVGLAFALLLVFVKKSDKSANLFLALALAVIVLKTGGITPLLLPALGPSLYLYVGRLTFPNQRFRQKDLLHFCSLPTVYWMPSWLILISVIIYLYMSSRLIERCYGQLQVVLMDRPRFAFRHLKKMLLLMSACCLLAFFDAIFYFAIASLLIGMAVTAILKMDDDRRLTTPITDRFAVREKGRRLNATVAANRFYEDPDLTLTTLAVKLIMHPHDLSRIINLGLEKNFSDFINEFRVREIARKMRDPAFDRIKLLGIAYESGFNSQRTFNRVFKEMTGKTPAEYKRMLEKELPIDKLATQPRLRPVILRPESPPVWAKEKLNCNYMFKDYFKTAVRSIRSNKVYSALNIVGLAIGIACAGLIFLWVGDEMTYDSTNIKKDRLYEVKINADFSGNKFVMGSTPRVMGKTIKAELPGIANVCRISDGDVKALFKIGDKSFYANGRYADPALFSMFTLPFVHGNIENAFTHLRSVVLTEKTARRFFGNDGDVLGKTIRVDNKNDYVVTGVLKDIPKNSTLQADWFIPYETLSHDVNIVAGNDLQDHVWNSYGPFTYVELEPNANIDTMNARLLNFIHGKDATQKNTAFLYPMTRWHLYDQFTNGKENSSGRISQVRLLSVIAWIILLIACINFMNLATARSEKRAKEIGVRKVLGSGRNRLIGQFMAESFLMSAMAAAIAVGIVAISLPAFNTLVEKDLNIGLSDPAHFLVLGLITVICGLLAGSYPSLYLSSFDPVKVLKGLKIKSGTATLIRKGLVILQFSVAIVFIISTIIIYQQIQHVKSRDLGFNKNNLVEIDMQHPVGRTFSVIKQQLMNTGVVSNAAMTDHVALYGGNTDNSFKWDGKGANDNFDIAFRNVTPEFMSTAGMHIIEGRDFGDEAADTTSVIVTQSLAKRIDKNGVVGKIIQSPRGVNEGLFKNLRIVGVVQDYVMGNIYDHAGTPVIFICHSSANFDRTLSQFDDHLVYVRIKDNKASQQTLVTITSIVQRNNSDFPFQYRFVDDQFNEAFKGEIQTSRISGIFATLAIIISCLGLFSLAAYTAERRIKEIGIRKVLGASVSGLAGLLSKDFLQLVGISCLVAFPVAWYIMHNWLQNYEYRVHIHWWIFAAAGVSAITIALATVSFQAVKAALANPVKSLRSE